MKIKTFVIGYVLALALFLFAQRHTDAAQPGGFRAIVDLTHTVNAKVPTFEVSEKPVYQVKTVATIEKNKYFLRNICLPEHFGTHIDAPAHFAKGTWTVDQIPPERLIAPLAIIAVTANVKRNPDYQISVEAIAPWEQTNGQNPPGALVITSTGGDSRLNSARS